MKKKFSITAEQFQTLDTAYKFFNAKLFNSELPDCMILLHRHGKRNLGRFHPERFFDRDELKDKKKAKELSKFDELSLNPDNFIGRTDTAILSTLVHEMAHVWQFHCTDKYPRNGYHDKKWGAKMEEIGLMPSNTGSEGGKRTGQQMTHYIIKNGKFEKAALSFLKNRKIKLTSVPLPSQSSGQNRNKIKYSCPSCDLNAWGKPGIDLRCGDCNEQLEEQ